MSLQHRHMVHSLTRKDREFNGLDVAVGDWIAGASDGKCLKIIRSKCEKYKRSYMCC